MPLVTTEGAKVYIPGVPRISWDTGEMCEFASALTAALRCLGDPIPYHYVMGTCGAAFRFSLLPGAWEYGAYSIRNIAAHPDEPIHRAMAAVGYQYALWERGPAQEDTDRIRASLDAGVPVLAFGVVGPSDCCILTGYDDGGATLLGWSTYQDIPDDHPFPHDVTGYFRKPGWHPNLGGYLVLGPRGESGPRRTVYLEALRWAVQLMRLPENGRMSTGLAALGLWAEEMQQARYFPAGDDQVLGSRYVSTAINMTMLRDHDSAAPFLRQVAAEAPDLAAGLAPAIACFDKATQLRQQLNGIIADDFSAEAMQAIADPGRRRSYAAGILDIQAKEGEALAALEQLLVQVSAQGSLLTGA
jgi:hypothetical protein